MASPQTQHASHFRPGFAPLTDTIISSQAPAVKNLRLGALLDFPPHAIARRGGEGVNDALDLQAAREIDRLRSPAVDCVKKLGKLDDFQFIEPQPMPRCRAEAAIGAMGWRRQDAPETAR